MHSKRGAVESNMELWFLLGSFILAAIAGVDLIQDTTERVEGTLLEKNFIARDLALTLDAIYAAPGDLEYEYNLGRYRFYIDVIEGNVLVREKRTEKDPVKYHIALAGNKFVKLDYLTVDLPKKECKAPSSLLLSKITNREGPDEIRISGKNFVICRAKDEACREQVAGCE